MTKQKTFQDLSLECAKLGHFLGGADARWMHCFPDEPFVEVDVHASDDWDEMFLHLESWVKGLHA